jgi:hypothetical protein
MRRIDSSVYLMFSGWRIRRSSPKLRRPVSDPGRYRNLPASITQIITRLGMKLNATLSNGHCRRTRDTYFELDGPCITACRTNASRTRDPADAAGGQPGNAEHHLVDDVLDLDKRKQDKHV